jgi:hypothetical protein
LLSVVAVLVVLRLVGTQVAAVVLVDTVTLFLGNHLVVGQVLRHR